MSDVNEPIADWTPAHSLGVDVLMERLEKALRERDEARTALEKTARENLMLKPALDGAIRQRDALIEELQEVRFKLHERDEARADLTHCRQALSSLNVDLKRIADERDEARAALAKAEGYAVYLSQGWQADCIVAELATWLAEAQSHCDARNVAQAEGDDDDEPRSPQHRINPRQWEMD